MKKTIEKLEELLKYTSKRDLPGVLEKIGADLNLFNEIAELSVSDCQPHAWHAAWVMDHYTDSDLDDFAPHLSKAYKVVLESDSESQIRIFLKVLGKYPLVDDYEVALYDFCKKKLLSNTVAVGVKANSMKLIHKICQKYPELLDEIQLMIKELLPYNQKPAFVHPARKLFGVVKEN
jgi:hypothetical protein